MTDQELCERLRWIAATTDCSFPVLNCLNISADRIEELSRELADCFRAFTEATERLGELARRAAK